MTHIFDLQRSRKNFLTLESLTQTIGKHNTILDSSVLIGENIKVGSNNTFYPGVVIEQQGSGKITIGDGNIFYPGVYILSSDGEIIIGNHNEFGPAGATIKANNSDALITIGNHGRYCDGANIMGKSTLGSGSQILGNITVQNCTLADGGTFQEPNPDERGAVLKGFGHARNIVLETGQVINGVGNFADFPIEQQSAYHPKLKI
jgi:carbonic anhydrase/acetyltransferase-like protein (isoleucine patch superfamily)